MGRRGAWLAGVAVVGVLVGAGCGGSTGEKAGAATLFHLQTGDCFHSPAGTPGRTAPIKDVTTVPCAEAHDGEVFAVVTHPSPEGAAYPGDEPMADFAAGECLTRFSDYTGSRYDDSDLQVASVRPDRDSWTDRHDRDVACVLYKQGASLTGSRRKA